MIWASRDEGVSWRCIARHLPETIVVRRAARVARGFVPRFASRSKHYRYASGREGDMPILGFSPRKAKLLVDLIRGKRVDVAENLLTFTTKRAAEAFANTVEVEKLTGSYVAPSLGQVTVSELGKEWLTRQAHHKASWSARLESVWRVHVEPKWGRRRIADIRKTEVQKWVADLKLSPSSVAHAHTVLAGILDDAVADRRLHGLGDETVLRKQGAGRDGEDQG